ncbi:aldo/keto reductase [Methylobacterium sp. 4-46]|uniref:aldo/keto reductase n=1 Tax=unclassified Methylobacterium TaxID=2615210 RepID=UPI000152C9DA|nr:MULTISPECIES: aldo/keto reductase [Methylobacterium]ACA14973.1 aldo/keto reductase [Methylobacterium sp. 4-46]WFT80711.1 aldo/keto reductase [Methylobacterium nodulans]
MRQRPLGRSGLTVSLPGLGCMGMSEFYGPADDAQSRAALEAALALGYDFLDTADTYGHGHNEALIGAVLAGRRDRAVVATKFGIVRAPGRYERRIDNSPAYVAAACEASLRRLGVETIDLYYCHRRDPAVPIEEVVGAMARLVEAGKVRALGLSEVSPATLRAAQAVHPIAAVQSEYSLWTREPEQGLLAACRDLGVALVAYSPLGRGFLTGAVDVAGLAQDDVRRANPRFRDEALARNARLAAALGTFAAERGASAAQVALAWLVTREPHVIPIPGTRKEARLAENAAAMEIRLTPEDLRALDALFAPGAVAGSRYDEAGMVGIETD